MKERLCGAWFLRDLASSSWKITSRGQRKWFSTLQCIRVVSITLLGVIFFGLRDVMREDGCLAAGGPPLALDAAKQNQPRQMRSVFGRRNEAGSAALEAVMARFQWFHERPGRRSCPPDTDTPPQTARQIK